MAEQIHIELVDDLDGSSAAETVSFALDGVAYDIDLNEQNAQMLRSVLADYTQAGRAQADRATTRAAATRREEQHKHRTRQVNKAHTHNIRQATDAVRHPRRRPQQPGKGLLTNAEPTIAAVIAEADRSSNQKTTTSSAPVPDIAPVEFQQAR